MSCTYNILLNVRAYYYLRFYMKQTKAESMVGVIGVAYMATNSRYILNM